MFQNFSTNLSWIEFCFKVRKAIVEFILCINEDFKDLLRIVDCRAFRNLLQEPLAVCKSSNWNLMCEKYWHVIPYNITWTFGGQTVEVTVKSLLKSLEESWRDTLGFWYIDLNVCTFIFFPKKLFVWKNYCMESFFIWRAIFTKFSILGCKISFHDNILNFMKRKFFLSTFINEKTTPKSKLVPLLY